MTRCEFCGGILHADIIELDGPFKLCKCDEQAHKREQDRKKQESKKTADHWKNGREKYNS